MLKKFFYQSNGLPNMFRCLVGFVVVMTLLSTLMLQIVIETNMVGDLIQYVKAEIAK